MPWADLVNAMDSACLATFGIPATFTAQDGSGAQQITGIIQNPAMAGMRAPISFLPHHCMEKWISRWGRGGLASVCCAAL